MPSDVSPAGDETAMCWEISTQPGARASSVRLVPDTHLTWSAGDGGPEWRSVGERPSFSSSDPILPGGLPAGWYEVRGQMQSSDGSALLPCLMPTYRQGMDGDQQIALPDPVSNGAVQGLLLCKYDVTRLQFSPGRGPSRFRLGSFRLERVSRVRALLRMLRPVPGEPAAARNTLVRALRFAVASLRGIPQATVALFDDYRRRLHPLTTGDYEAWVQRFDTLGDEHLAEMHARAARLGADSPLISVLLPVYQTPERWLRRCLDSVIHQVYPHWQLCVVDDASPDPRVMQLLDDYARKDARITVMRRPTNGHISQASNSALGLAKGDYVALLDHDDELRPHALLEMAEAIVADPLAHLLYSDEDKIDVQGRRFDPYFKPDWDPDLLRSQNYVCHFTCIRTDLVRDVQGFREGFEGSQDHDLILRCVERLRPDQIHHIPKVLYHWRAIPGSTALTRDAKDYASSAGAKAVDQHLHRCHPGARAQELSHGHYRIRWPLPSPPPKVSLIIPTRDKVELLRMCVESILERTTYPDFEIVVVDNQSSDAKAISYLAELETTDRVRVVRYDAPFNYSAINNRAVGHASGDVVGLVNNDIEVITPDWLEEMVSHALRPDIGAVGAMLYYPNDTIQHAGVVLGVHGVAAHLYAGLPRGYPGHGGRARVAQELSAVTGACLLVRRDLYEQLGGLDESLQVAFNDIDFCLRLREAGYRNIWTPFAEMYHHESASRGVEDTDEKKQRFAGEVEFMRQRWSGVLTADPAYNVNLSLNSLACELAVPPR